MDRSAGNRPTDQNMTRRARRGFTLVEIMVVVAIIALLAAIGLPGYLRARKRSQGTSVKNDLRLIDGAIDQYALEYNLAVGPVAWSALTRYFKPGTQLAQGQNALVGVVYASGSYSIDSALVVPTAAYSALSDVLEDSFWSPYATP
jgi:prepilin-type N-terminal cleavage/methylation domain-containing protein